MVRKIDNGPALIEKWLRNKNTIEFSGIWEEMYNADFNTAAYEEIMLEAGSNRFIMSVKQWVSPQFKLYLIKEFGKLLSSANGAYSSGSSIANASKAH